MTLFDLLEQRVPVKRTGHRDGGEYHSSCLKCGGEDRFMFWPSAGNFFCRQCGWAGDAITILREIDGLTFPQALRALGRDVPLALVRKHPTHRALEQTRAAYRQWEAAMLDRITRDFWHAWDWSETIELQLALLLCQREPGTAEEWEQWQRAFDRAQQDAWVALAMLDFFQHPATSTARVALWEATP